MKKAPKGIKRKGYVEGGKVQLDANGNPIMSENEKDARQFGNAAGNALGGYSGSYYATKENVSEGDSVRSAGLAAVGKTGAIGGAVSGIAAIGDQIGKPTRDRSEKVDMYGDVKDERTAKRNAMIGTTFSPSQRLSYKGGLTDISGDAYIASLEAPKKAQIAAEKMAASEDAVALAKLKRNQGETSFSSPNTYRPSEFSKGGEIKGKGTGTSDSINAEVEHGSFVVPAENADMAKRIKSALGMKNGKAKLHQKNGVPVKLSNGEELLTPEQKETVEDKLGDDVLEKLAPEAEEDGDKVEGYAKGTPKDGVTKIGDKKPNTETKKTTPKKTYKSKSFVPREYISPIKPDLSAVETEDALKEINNPNANAIDTNPVATTPTKAKTGFWDKVGSVNTDGLGSAIANYGLAAYQINEGRKGLKDKRPVNTIDPTFLENVNTAQKNAKFGFTGEQQFLLDQQNQNLLNADTFAAKNYSGGSGGNAFNMQRNASNNAFMRSLQNASANTELQQSKQQFAAQTALQKANLSRAIFEDSLRAYEMKQGAAGAAVNAGISNVFDANRFANFMRLRNEENSFNNKYNP